jgi:hypothetical protein
MVDFADFSAMVQSLNAISNIAKALLGLRDEALIKEKVVELTGQIITAQQGALAAQLSQQTLLKDKDTLEKELVEFKAWDGEKEKYQLTKLTPYSDVFGYVVKPEHAGTGPTPPHCANCFESRIKSVLQKETRVPLAEVLVCVRCGSELYLSGHRHAEHSGSRKSTRR